MRTLLRKKFVLAVFCLLVLPATASADAVVTGPCGSSTLAGQMIFGPCALPGGGSALYGAQATFATNSFLISHSPVVVLGGAGQVNSFAMSIHSGHIFSIWTVPGPVPTALFLNGDRKSTRLNSSHSQISYAVFCLKKKKKKIIYMNY